jgi:hypothetical protein
MNKYIANLQGCTNTSVQVSDGELIFSWCCIRFGLDGPGIESRSGRDFSHTSGTVLGPTQPPVQWVLGLSRVKSGRGVVLTTHPLLVPRSRKDRAIPLCLFRPVTGILYLFRIRFEDRQDGSCFMSPSWRLQF